MIEAGFVLLVQAGLGSPPLAPGGFAVQLPKDQISPVTPYAWTYRSIVSDPTYVLEGQDPFTSWEIQLDCHGYTMQNAITLARAVDVVLRGGYSGVLSDTDRTRVFGIFRRGPFLDGYSDANRSFVRTMEYEIQYAQI
jgi:hypothetical protein